MNEFKPEPVTKLPVDDAILQHEQQIDVWKKELKWLRTHRDAIKDLPKPCFCGGGVDFDNLTHAQVVTVIRTVGGKWKKQPASDETLHYNSEKELGGRRVRCYNSKPPPSCKIIEVEEHVPAQVIPATVRKVRKLVCQPEVGAIIASAAERGVTEQSEAELLRIANQTIQAKIDSVDDEIPF